MKNYSESIMSSKLVKDLNASICFSQLVDAYFEYQQVVETERTKRAIISAHEQVALAKIEQQRQLMMQFFTSSFNERAQTFDSYFKLADQAIAQGNNEQLSKILDNILDLAKHSPFKDLADIKQLGASLDDPNHTWEF